MKALILNSGLGSRMGKLTAEHPKCMTEISDGETILSRQLRLFANNGISDIIMTTGYFDKVLVDYCEGLHLPLRYTFVPNPLYRETNYIYSIYCAREFLSDGDDFFLLHGDLVYEESVLKGELSSKNSVMAVSSSLPLPEKDFKAVICNNRIKAVGIEFFDNALAAQPLYKICNADWMIWLNQIISYCESDDKNKRKCYAEKAFNEVSDICAIYPYDCKDALCAEIDDPEDLKIVSSIITSINNKGKR